MQLLECQARIKHLVWDPQGGCGDAGLQSQHLGGEAGASQVQGHPQLQRKLKASLGYGKFFLKKTVRKSTGPIHRHTGSRGNVSRLLESVSVSVPLDLVLGLDKVSPPEQKGQRGPQVLCVVS